MSEAPIPKKFKIGDSVKWLGNPKRFAVEAEGIVNALPQSGTRYCVHITRAINPTLTNAVYWVEAAKLELIAASETPPLPS